MIQLNFSIPNNLSQLHDELLAEHPELIATMRVEGQGEAIWLTVPDGTDEASITAIVTAHTPQPRLNSDYAAFRRAMAMDAGYQRCINAIASGNFAAASAIQDAMLKCERKSDLEFVAQLWNLAIGSTSPTETEIEDWNAAAQSAEIPISFAELGTATV